jgi:hypothetical protein
VDKAYLRTRTPQRNGEIGGLRTNVHSLVSTLQLKALLGLEAAADWYI